MKNFSDFTIKEKRQIVEQTNYTMEEWKKNDELLIEVDEFTDYARELAEDIGEISSSSNWIASCVDWEKAGDMLAEDYSSINIGDEEYLYRAW